MEGKNKGPIEAKNEAEKPENQGERTIRYDRVPRCSHTFKSKRVCLLPAGHDGAHSIDPQDLPAGAYILSLDTVMLATPPLSSAGELFQVFRHYGKVSVTPFIAMLLQTAVEKEPWVRECITVNGAPFAEGRVLATGDLVELLYAKLVAKSAEHASVPVFDRLANARDPNVELCSFCGEPVAPTLLQPPPKGVVATECYTCTEVTRLLPTFLKNGGEKAMRFVSTELARFECARKPRKRRAVRFHVEQWSVHGWKVVGRSATFTGAETIASIWSGKVRVVHALPFQGEPHTK